MNATFYDQWKEHIALQISEALRLLLSTKHLYQSVTVNISKVQAILDQLRSTKTHDSRTKQEELAHLLPQFWAVESTVLRRDKATAPGIPLPFISVKLPPVKLYCHICKRLEAYNPFVDKQDTKDWIRNYTNSQESSRVYQALILDYQCQSCHGNPETFLIRREGFKITLCGRSPIEHVDVPSYIPTKQGKYYSDALVAHQSGHTLEALFMLRTFIEQYCYERHQDTKDRADQAVDAYMGTLPPDFTSRFPSFRKLYEDLSASLHKADDDSVLFDRAMTEINLHFEARRLYKLP